MRRLKAPRIGLIALSATFASAAFTLSSSANACGGFWCSQTAPVNQTAEQIVFVDNPDGTTTCIVQIQYAGPSEKFAWVLPVQGVPDVNVSSNIALSRLDQATRPQYRLERHVEGECDSDPLSFGFAGAADAAATPPTAAESRSVDVLAQGSVGPYDYVVIHPDPGLPSPADVAIDWLNGEGYDVTGISSDVLGPYLSDGLNLIAFRLTKGSPTGAIRPVILDYEGDLPTIPIRPTAVAAQDDMGILVWVLSEAQAVPKNYRSLILNEALINWFNPLSTYDQVVTAAANEAGGQGFVTEMAGASTAVEDTVFSTSDSDGYDQLTQQTFADPIDLIFAANAYYRNWDGWREAIEAAVTLPPGGSIDEFGRNPDAYRGVDGFSVDTELFLDKLNTDVVEPVRKTQEIVDSRPYLTRLYSTMSADEMTRDPVFTFNPDLAPISNVHTADLYIQCNPGIYEYEAPWRIELPHGGTIVGNGQQGPWPLALDGTVPANRKVVQLYETGAGEVIDDNRSEIASVIVQRGGMTTPPTADPSPPDGGMVIGGTDDGLPAMSGSGDSGGCSVPAAPEKSRDAGWLALLAGAALALARGRRRR